jgi:hypothetical protein
VNFTNLSLQLFRELGKLCSFFNIFAHKDKTVQILNNYSTVPPQFYSPSREILS